MKRQSDVQDLAQAVEISRQGAVDSLRFTGGDLSAAFKVRSAQVQSFKCIAVFFSYFVVLLVAAAILIHFSETHFIGKRNQIAAWCQNIIDRGFDWIFL